MRHILLKVDTRDIAEIGVREFFRPSEALPTSFANLALELLT